MTGGYFKSGKQGKILEENKRIKIKTRPNETNCSTDILFINNHSLTERNYYIQNLPDIKSCDTNMIVHVNFDNITKHLLIQRIFNNYYYVTGPIFIILGVIFGFLGFYENLILVSICFLFGQIITFIIGELIIGINKKYFEFLLISIGLIIGAISIYFSKKYLKYYKFVMGMTSGSIFGTFITEIFIFPFGVNLIFSIYINNLLISSASFLIIVYVIKKFYLYLYSIIGGYICIRGLSILLFKLMGYKELQLILYFSGSFEYEYFFVNSDRKLPKELNWDNYWIYDLLIIVSIIISIIFYRFKKNLLKRKLKFKDEEEYDAEKTEENLNKDLL